MKSKEGWQLVINDIPVFTLKAGWVSVTSRVWLYAIHSLSDFLKIQNMNQWISPSEYLKERSSSVSTLITILKVDYVLSFYYKFISIYDILSLWGVRSTSYRPLNTAERCMRNQLQTLIFQNSFTEKSSARLRRESAPCPPFHCTL